MTAPGQTQGACHVVDGDKLPAAAGGVPGVCATIESAMGEHAPKLHYSVEVRVLSKSALVATVSAGGKQLARQQLAVMDRNLNAASIRRFADALAAEVAKASQL